MIRCKYLRIEEGKSQSEVAREARLHNSTVCMIENRRMVPYPSQLSKLARSLGWEGDPAELLEDVEA